MGSASFLESVSENFDRVATLLELPSGLAEKIPCLDRQTSACRAFPA
jgi:hypothetical protein